MRLATVWHADTPTLALVHQEQVLNLKGAVAGRWPGSKVMTLEPGDVIATGTPAGVGATTKEYLQAGDVVEAEIEGIGTLRNHVVAKAAFGPPA